MQVGLIGAGRMGANMARRLLRGGHACAVFDAAREAVQALEAEGAEGASSIAELVARLAAPRIVWLMVPAAAVDATLAQLRPQLAPGDLVVDGGNSHHADDQRRARELAAAGIDYLDVGTSGGVWGLERGYCLMIGGSPAAVARLAPVFETLAPGRGAAAPTPGRAKAPARKGAEGPAAETRTADRGWLHCGPHGAGHFVKMVHNGIEYGLMAAYAEGFNVLRGANAGAATHAVDAETAPMREAGRYAYDFDLPEIAELWRRGSVVASWLLDLTAAALAGDPALEGFAGRVSDSGEGRWTIQAAIDEGVPVPVLSAALYGRFSSQGRAAFQDKLLSAMRWQFGGHAEKPRGD